MGHDRRDWLAGDFRRWVAVASVWGEAEAAGTGYYRNGVLAADYSKTNDPCF